MRSRFSMVHPKDLATNKLQNSTMSMPRRIEVQTRFPIHYRVRI